MICEKIYSGKANWNLINV